MEVADEKIKEYEKELERQSGKIKELMKKNTFLQESLTKVNEEINQISTKLNQKTKEVREAENKRISLERQVQELESTQRQQ